MTKSYSLSEVELTKEQLLYMTCKSGHQRKIIYARTDVLPPEPERWVVVNLAEHIVRDWNCDFQHLGYFDGFFHNCVKMYENWDWDKADPIQITTDNPDGSGFRIINGHHRSLTLACLVLQEKIDYKGLRSKIRMRTDLDRHLDCEQIAHILKTWTDHSIALLGFLKTRTDHRDYFLGELKEMIVGAEGDFNLLSAQHPYFAKLQHPYFAKFHSLFESKCLPNDQKLSRIKIYAEFENHEFFVKKEGKDYFLRDDDQVGDALLCLYVLDLEMLEMKDADISGETKIVIVDDITVKFVIVD